MTTTKRKYQEFYIDTAKEQIKEFANLLLLWEKKTDDSYLVEDILRLTHSMKGAAATMDYQKTAAYLHKIEDIFYAISQGNLASNDKLSDTLFKVADNLKGNIQSIATGGKEKITPSMSKDLDKLLKFDLKQKNNNFLTKDVSLRNINHSQKTFYAPLDVVVPTLKLDKIQANVDSLVVNQMRLKNARTVEDKNKLFSVAIENDKIIGDLRREIAELRLLPLQQIFTPLPHLVRELAKAEHKTVELVMEDNNFSLDKSIIDDLMDIIIQLLRNAVVHGIGPDQTSGQIILRAEIESDDIKITVADNGQGIDWQKIMDQALQKKIITPEQSKSLTVKDIRNLIFHPGLSATAKPNIRSGRGLGLNLVKQRVEALKGKLLLESGKNRGTKFIIYLPLPISIFKSLVFTVNQFVLAIPLLHVEKIIRLPQVQDFGKQKNFIYQKQNYPLLALAKILNLPPWSLSTSFLALIKHDNKVKILPLPNNIREEEIVSKRTPKILAKHPVISGVAVDANGQPVLVLDVHNLMI